MGREEEYLLEGKSVLPQEGGGGTRSCECEVIDRGFLWGEEWTLIFAAVFHSASNNHLSFKMI